MELLHRVKSSSNTTEETRKDNTSLVEPIVLAIEASDHHEDDLDPDRNNEEDENKDKTLSIIISNMILSRIRMIMCPKHLTVKVLLVALLSF